MEHERSRGGRGQPVARDVLFRSPVLEIRDNRCGREDPGLSRETAPLPWHEVTLPRRGIWYRHLGRAALPVDCHHAHFLNRGETHRVSHPQGCGDCNTGLVVRPQALHDVARAADPAATPDVPFARTHARLDSRADLAHRALLAAARRGPREALLVEELALRLVATLLRAPATGGAKLVKSQRDLAEAARGVLHRDLDRALSLADVAAEVGSSPFHVCRVFAAATGMTLHRYRVGMKLRAAVGLLLETELPLASIAAATGFHDRSHLSRVVARHAGIPPLELRRRSRTDLRDLLRALLPG